MPNSYVEITSNGSGSQSLAFSFPYLNQTDIGVTVDGVAQTLTTHWSFATTQSIVFGSHPANGAVIRISRTTPSATRVVDFQDGSVLSEADLDNSADQIFFIAQEAADTAAQSIILDTDGKWEAQSKPIKNVTNPTNAQDAVTKNYLENTWLSTSDKTQLNNLNTTNLNTVAGAVGNVNTVAGAVSNVNTVAGKSTEIAALGTTDNVSNMDTLAASGVVGNIASVAGISSDVTTVAGKASLITSDFVSDLNTVAVTDVINDINLLAHSDVVSDLNQLATSDFVSDLNQLATTTNVNNLGTVAGIAGNVTSVAGVASDVSTVAGISSAVSTVAADGTDIGTVAGISSAVSTVSSNNANVSTVAGAVSNIGTVAGAVSNVNTVAGAVSNVNTVAGISSAVSTVAADATDIGNVSGSIANVNTVATNISGVNSFAAQYRTGSSDPTDSLDEGDLFYNTTANQLKIYNGTQWENAAPAGSGFLATSGGTMSGNLVVNATITANELTVDGGVLSVDASSNRVGVNQNSPSTDLYVSHTANNTATLTPSVVENLGLRIKGDNASNTTGNIYSGVSLGEGYAGIYGYDGGSSAATGFGVFTGTNADVDKRITVDANGDISFYDTSENAKLLWDASATAFNVTGTVQADQYNNDEALPDIRPSLLLDFANSKTLDPRITFTRGSTATYYDGVTTAKAEENLLTYSQEFDNAVWNKTDTTVTANDTAAPDGTTTADEFSHTSTTAGFYYSATVVTGATYTVSVYTKYVDHQWFRLLADIGSVWFDIQNGTKGTEQSGVSGAISSVGNGWYLLTATYVPTDTSAQISLLLANADGSFTETSGTSAYIWGAQLEQRSAPTAYTQTTSAPVVKYQPTLQTAASGAARFDHSPTTGESKGLLIEEARTNLAPYSEAFDNGQWDKTRVNITANNLIAPDGTLTADKMVPNTTNDEHYIQDALTSATGVFTDSVYAKTDEVENYILAIRPVHVGADQGATQEGYFNLNTGTVHSNTSGTTASIEDVGNGWYRCSIAYTVSGTLSGLYGARVQLYELDGNDSIVGTYTGDDYSGVFLWGAQREAGSFPTSYIPTSGSTVTRASDDAYIDGADFNDFYSAGQGALYAEYIGSLDTFCGVAVLQSAFNGFTSRISLLQISAISSEALVSVNSVTQAQFSNNTVSAGLPSKAVVSYAENDVGASMNGDIQTDTSAVIPSDITALRIGGMGGGTHLNSTIKKIAIYSKRLPNATLQAMTTE